MHGNRTWIVASRPHGGFTLLEVLVSIAILSALVVSANTLSRDAIQNVRAAELRSKAQFVFTAWRAETLSLDVPPLSRRIRDSSGDLWRVKTREIDNVNSTNPVDTPGEYASRHTIGLQVHWYEATARRDTDGFSLRRVVVYPLSETGTAQ